MTLLPTLKLKVMPQIPGQQGPQGPQGPEGSIDFSDDLPLTGGTGSAGVSEQASRSDHIHPTDTSLVIVSDTAPVGEPDNSLWWESDTGLLYINYNDGTSTQWVQVGPAGIGGSSGQFQYNDNSDLGGANLWRADANTIEQRNGATAQVLRVYNTHDGGSPPTNYERMALRFSSGAVWFTHENNGSGLPRQVNIQGSPVAIWVNGAPIQYDGDTLNWSAFGSPNAGGGIKAEAFDSRAFLHTTNKDAASVAQPFSHGDFNLTKTANHSVPAAENGIVYDNAGAGGAVVFTLPVPVRGMVYSFYVATAAALDVKTATPASQTIRIAGNVTSAAGKITASAIGGYVELLAISTTAWVAKCHEGTWTVS